MKKILALLIISLILFNTMGTATAQEDEDCTEDDCDDCTACRTNYFYYVIIAGLSIFVVLFYLRNRAPEEPEKPVEKDD